jgi:hypothetical protein
MRGEKPPTCAPVHTEKYANLAFRRRSERRMLTPKGRTEADLKMDSLFFTGCVFR